jgi:spore coat protein H
MAMKIFGKFALFIGVLAVFISTSSPLLAQDGTWDKYTHGDSTDPDYAVIFPQDKVNTINITISPQNWQAMLDNMTELYGKFGSRSNGRGLGGPGNGMPGMFAGENPKWVTANIQFENQTWNNVGIRFKGNSSLASSWSGGSYKLGFKLDFDEFEDAYPEIKNQRFYGFQQLSFSSNWSDASLLREKVTADIFREAGIPSAQTAFYAVYINYGKGPVYFGLYTVVEVVEDTVIETQFTDNSGNLYKPEGNGATFAAGSFNEKSFEKETNQKEADYKDIQALFEALHSKTRTTDPAAWRSKLETVLDVDEFMHWLAVNSVIQNWDTYGQMSHNYYLYHNPSTGLLTWIPWDNNMALSSGFGGRRGGGMNTTNTLASLDHTGVGNNWPLIRYLMDDPVYHALYVKYVEKTITAAFESTKMSKAYQRLHALIAPYVVGENGEKPGYTHLSSADAFESSLTELIDHAKQRYALAKEYIGNQVVK